MVKFSEILLEVVVAITCLIAAVILMLSFPFLFFVPLIIYWIIHIQLARIKKITKYVKEDFQKLGYTILSERPPKLFESAIKVKPAILVNGMPLSRYGYMRKFHRIFKVKTEANDFYEIYADVTKMWNGKNTIEIVRKKKLEGIV